MGIYEEVEKGIKKDTVAENPEQEPKKNKTLKEIRASGVDFDRFGKYLDKEGEQALGKKFIAGELGRDEEAALAKKKEEFLILMERADEVAKTLDAKTIEKIAETSPDLKNIVGNHGAEGIRSALKNRLHEIAISDPDHFDALSESVTVRATHEKGRDEDEKEIQKGFKEFGITDDAEIAKIINGGDATEFAKKIAKKKMGWLRKRFGRGPSEEAIDEIKGKIENLAKAKSGDIKKRLQDIDESLTAIGGALEASLMDNPEIKKALIADTLGESAEEIERDMPFHEVKDSMVLDKAAAKAAWEAKIGKYHLANKEEREGAAQTALEKFLAEAEEKAWKEYLENYLKQLFDQQWPEVENQRRQQALETHLSDAAFKQYLEPMGVPMDKIAKDDLAALKTDFLRANKAPDFGLDDADSDRLTAEFLAGYKPPSDAEKAEAFEKFKTAFTEDDIKIIRAEFAKTYVPPDKDAQDKFVADFTREYEKTEIDETTYEGLQSEFADSYTGSHMAGRKKGFWSNIAAEFFKKGIFDDLFGSIL